MSIKNICCLCFVPCSDYHFMQNESGESTDIYDVTVKYFDPMILTEYQDDVSVHLSLRVLCSGCWSHIYDFHEFQQSVLKARTVLHEAKEQKLDIFVMQETTTISADNKYQSSDDGMSVGSSVDLSSDLNDDVPLRTLFRQTRRQTRAKTKHDSGVNTPIDNSISLNAKTDVDKDPPSKTLPTSFNSKENVDEELTTTQNIPENDETAATAIKFEKELAGDLSVLSLAKAQDGMPGNNKPRNRKVQSSSIEQDQNYSLNENSKKASLKKKRNKSTRPVRKNKTTITQNKIKKPSSGNLIEKRRENDTFIAQWKPILDCDLCSATVSNFDEMRDHFRAAHDTRYYIKCCERKFYRRYALIAHIRLHVNPETYKCDICGRLSTTKHNLQLHKRVVHSEAKEFECEICHKFFNQKPNLERHLLIHVEGDKNFFCKECGRGYVLEVQLKSHMKSVHEVNNICDQCGKICHGQGALKSHLKEHAGVKRRKFPCDICGVEIVSKIGLKRHKAAFHHDGSTAYVCGICGKVTSSENALRHHKKYVHEKIKKYKCTYCDKAFMQPKGLREHIASHTGVDLYQCPHCPQTFKVSANMHHHRKRAHPVEWEEGRKNKVALPKVNIEKCTNQVVL